MEKTECAKELPLNTRVLVLGSVFMIFPVLVYEQALFTKEEITASLAGHIFGPLFVLAFPLSYKLQFMFGSFLTCLSSALSFLSSSFQLSPLFASFVLGLAVSYLKTVAGLFCNALCLKRRKKECAALLHLTVAWVYFFTFFSLRFIPSLIRLTCSTLFVCIFTLLGSWISYRCIIETPEEIAYARSGQRKISGVYEDLNSTLLYLNGPNAQDTDAIRKEYREIMEAKNASQRGVFDRASCVLSFVNVSFIYVAFQRAAGVEGRHSLYRVFLGAMHLCSWSFTYASGTTSLSCMLIPVLAVYFICVSTNNYRELGLALLMLFGVTFSPSSAVLYRMDQSDRVVGAFLQGVLSLCLFLGIMFYIF